MWRCKNIAPALLAVCVFGSSAFAQEEGIEEIVVEATRSGRRVQDEPIHVDVLSQEEIEEKQIMRPGNIAMMLSETGGLRVQKRRPPWARPIFASRGLAAAIRNS